MADFLAERLGAHLPVADLLDAGAFVDGRGRPWRGADPYRANAFVWFHRPLRAEPPVPGEVRVLYADDRLVVVDKPHFLATTPRGAHVAESVVARLRVALDLPDLVPAHRLDRLTAGVLVLTCARAHRGAYAGLFATRRAAKTYEAIAPHAADLEFPRLLTGRIEKRRGRLQAELVPGEPNAETLVELAEVRGPWARYRLTPTTGKTHQLRLQLAALGLPIAGDPLYPEIRDVEPADFSTPLALVARRLRFTDPVDGTERVYASGVPLRWPDQPPVGG